MRAEAEQAPASAPASVWRQAKPSAWWALAVLFLLYTISIVDRHILTMVASDIKRDLELSDTETGLVLGAAFSISYAVFGLPLGWAADHLSRRLVIFVGVLIFGAATAATGLANSFAALFLCRALVGIGEAALSPAAYSLLSEKFPRELQTTASSIYNTAAKLGTAAAYTIGAAAIAYSSTHLPELQPWRFTFFVVGIPAALLGALVLTFGEKRVRPNSADGDRFAAWIYFKEHGDLLIPMLVGFTLVTTMGATLLAWTPSYLTRHFGLTPTEFAPALSLISLLAAVTLVFKGGIVDWLFARGVKDAHMRFYTWMLLAAAPLAGAMFFIENSTVFMIMFGVVQVVAVPIMIFAAGVLQVVVPPHVKGQIVSVFIFTQAAIGGGLGPILIGALTDHVFQDENSLGHALAVMVFIAVPIGYLCLRRCLGPLRRHVEEIEAARSAG